MNAPVVADPGTGLARAIARSADASDCAVTIGDRTWRRWASATFSGARHRLEVVAPPSPAFDTWLATLREAELTVRGHLVADIEIVEVVHGAEAITAAIEALTVELDGEA